MFPSLQNWTDYFLKNVDNEERLEPTNADAVSLADECEQEGQERVPELVLLFVLLGRNRLALDGQVGPAGQVEPVEQGGQQEVSVVVVHHSGDLQPSYIEGVLWETFLLPVSMDRPKMGIVKARQLGVRS